MGLAESCVVWYSVICLGTQHQQFHFVTLLPSPLYPLPLVLY